jgi:hypothetical protein
MGDTDLEYLLSSGGEGVVDVVLYMIPRTGKIGTLFGLIG